MRLQGSESAQDVSEMLRNEVVKSHHMSRVLDELKLRKQSSKVESMG